MKKLVLLLTITLVSCSENAWLDDILGIQGAEADISSSADINQRLMSMEEEANRIVELVSEKGLLYQRLGMEYIEREVYGPAREAFQAALEYYPLSPDLHYYLGATSTALANGTYDSQRRAALVDQAEAAHRKALEFSSRHRRALYALAVLLHYEREDDIGALEYIDRFLAADSGNTRGRFLKGRIHYSLGNTAAAISTYEELLDHEDPVVRSQAEQNLEQIFSQGL